MATKTIKEMLDDMNNAPTTMTHKDHARGLLEAAGILFASGVPISRMEASAQIDSCNVKVAATLTRNGQATLMVVISPLHNVKHEYLATFTDTVEERIALENRALRYIVNEVQEYGAVPAYSTVVRAQAEGRTVRPYEPPVQK